MFVLIDFSTPADAPEDQLWDIKESPRIAMAARREALEAYAEANEIRNWVIVPAASAENHSDVYII